MAVALLVAAAPAAADPVAITAGSLNWGVKASFRNYVGAGGIAVAGGVTRVDAGASVDGLAWPVQSGSFDASTRALELRFAGSVHFSAHEGALDLTLASPRLLIDGAQETLLARVRSRPIGGGEIVDYGEIPVARLHTSAVPP